METYPAKVHTAFKLLLVCLFGIFYLPAVLAQQTDKAFFVSEVDTAFHQIYVGKEVQLRYLSNREMEKCTPPVWDAEEVERISGPHPMSSSRMTMVNGNSEIVSLQGFYFAIRFLKPGTVTLPAITAIIEGNTYTCASAVVNVLPAKNSEGVVCTLTTEPAMPKAGQEFKLILVCNREPDPRTPAFQHPGIEQLSSSNMYSSRNGVEEYRFVYRMKAERPGSYVITPLDLTFGGVEYPLNTYPLDIESSNYLWVFVIFFLFAGVLINYWMQFHKERNEGLAAFVMRTGRMNLSVDNALTHYGLSVFMLFIPFIITGIAIYKCLRGLLSFLKLRFYWALSAFLRCCSSCFPIRNTGNCFFWKGGDQTLFGRVVWSDTEVGCPREMEL